MRRANPLYSASQRVTRSAKRRLVILIRALLLALLPVVRERTRLADYALLDTNKDHYSPLLSRLQEHHIHTPNSIEIPQLVDEFANPRRGSVAERRFKTPLAMMLVMRRSDDVLEFVLESMKIAENEGVFVVEGDCCDTSPLISSKWVWRSVYSCIASRAARDRDSSPSASHASSNESRTPRGMFKLVRIPTLGLTRN